MSMGQVWDLWKLKQDKHGLGIQGLKFSFKLLIVTPVEKQAAGTKVINLTAAQAQVHVPNS